MRVSVIGMGYVGLSNAVLLSLKNNVVCHDIDTSKLESINKRVSPIKDDLITSYFKHIISRHLLDARIHLAARWLNSFYFNFA